MLGREVDAMSTPPNVFEGPSPSGSDVSVAKVQLDNEIDRLKAALSARQAEPRPPSHSVITAYKQQIAKHQADKADQDSELLPKPE